MKKHEELEDDRGDIIYVPAPKPDEVVSPNAIFIRGIMLGMTGALGIVWAIVEIFGP